MMVGLSPDLPLVSSVHLALLDHPDLEYDLRCHTKPDPGHPYPHHRGAGNILELPGIHGKLKYSTALGETPNPPGAPCGTR